MNLRGIPTETLNVMTDLGFAGTRAVHDLLLAVKPEDHVHEPETCVFCTANDSPEGGMTTYTEDQLRQELDRATAALRDEIATLTSKLGATEQDAAITAAVEEATAPLNEQVADLTAKLDEATIEARTHKEAHDNLVAYLDGERERQDNETAAAERRDARIAAAKEAVPAFTDEDIAARADNWASLDDAAFAVQLDEYRAVVARVTPAGGGTGTGARPPAQTAMTASDGTGNGAGPSDHRSVVRDALALRGTVLDPSTLR